VVNAFDLPPVGQPKKQDSIMSKVVTPKAVSQSLAEFWSPRIIGEVDNNYVKVAKLHGTFTWHTHEDEDELFFVLKGRLVIEMKDQTVTLNEGDMFVVPKGVAHNPIAEEECQVLLFEKKDTLHTGEVQMEKSRSIEEQLR
jgi:mannose-6-phosphate isomerase-like protein (cupin superfamily)